MAHKKLKELNKQDLQAFFRAFEKELEAKKQYARYTLLGGAALVLLDIVSRSTTDIDIAPETTDSALIDKAAEKAGITIQRITVCTTVDFTTCPKQPVFTGTFLHVDSISPCDLLKSKIERFERQDYQDIHALVAHLNLSYVEFKKVFSEMTADFVGNPNKLIMQARTVVERIYAAEAEDFRSSFKLSFE